MSVFPATNPAAFALVTVARPLVEPVTTDEAKLHLRVDHAAEDTLIARLVTAAREKAEQHCGKAWLTQTLRLELAGWPCDGVVRLPVGPLQSVSSVRYYDLGGTLTTLAGSAYQVWGGHSPPLVLPAPLTTWPAVQTGRYPAVLVEFVAGDADATAVPQCLCQAVLLTVGYWYEHRGDGRDPTEMGLPRGVLNLLDSLWAGGYR